MRAVGANVTEGAGVPVGEAEADGNTDGTGDGDGVVGNGVDDGATVVGTGVGFIVGIGDLVGSSEGDGDGMRDGIVEGRGVGVGHFAKFDFPAKRKFLPLLVLDVTEPLILNVILKFDVSRKTNSADRFN